MRAQPLEGNTCKRVIAFMKHTTDEPMPVLPRLLRRIMPVVAATLLLFPLTAKAASDQGVTTENLILRAKPSASGVPLATIRKGGEVTILSEEGNWVKIKTGSVTGYVQASFISSEKKEDRASSSSSSSSQMLKLGDESDAVRKLQQDLKTLGYLNADATGTFGSATRAAVKAFQDANGLEADGVAGSGTLSRIERRLSSSQAASSVTTLEKGAEGDQVKALQLALREKGFFTDDVTGYYGSKTQTAVKAYQLSLGIKADGVAGADTLAKLNQGAGATALKLGDTGDSVTELQRLLKTAGFYSGSADGKFGEGTQAALIAYQRAAGLSTDGVAGAQTITKLATNSVRADTKLPTIGGGSSSGSSDSSGGSSSSGGSGSSSSSGSSSKPDTAPSQTNGSIKLVDWWSGEIDSAIPRKSTAQVLDVRTGITFNIHRYGGTNHLDWEPLTQEDTQKLYSITGGDYSWSARPVIVTASNGTRYAAAINTYPHGESHLNDNGYNGKHNCMHFLNSTTHGTGNVNQGMQKEIMVAFNSGK